MDDYSVLKKLAMGATGQFWNETIDGVMAHDHGSAICHTGALPNHEANKAFIAACGPMPVLDLISKYECKAEFLDDFIACHKRQNVKINDLVEALEMLLYTRTQERGLQNAKPGESPLHDRCRAAIDRAKGYA